MLDRATRGVPSDFLDPLGSSLVDLYLIVHAVEGLAPGAYYYRRSERSLEFLRVRASEFYCSPDPTLKKLERRLAGLEIRPLPEGSAIAAPDANRDPLDARVRKRAEQIRARWKDVPTVSSVFGNEAAPDDAEPVDAESVATSLEPKPDEYAANPGAGADYGESEA